MLPSSFALQARWVFPIDAAPIENGVVRVEGERISGVGTDSPPLEATDLGNVAILPGFVNAHAHLEFSDLTEPLGRRGMSLAEWILWVLQYRNRGDLPPLAERVSRGVDESLGHGTTTIGEIASQPYLGSDVATDRGELTVFLEMIGRDPRRVQNCVRAAEAHLSGDAAWQSGLSPHAPYTIGPELLAAAARLVAGGAPLAMHLAESPEEMQWFADGTGALAEMLSRSGDEMAGPPAFTSPLQMIRQLRDIPRVALIHGNYLDAVCIAEIAKHAATMSVVYCPRTHGYFGHARYPLDGLLTSGINVALGTDGLSSNPDLSLLAELRFAAERHPEISAATFLRLATINGAEALGRETDVGTLTAGKSANLAILQLPEPSPDDVTAKDPARLIVASELPNIATMFRGQVVYGRL
ncbi:MAG: amidohydrolase family protein [Pirellulales bacterium]